MSTFGIILMALLLPTGIILVFLAMTKRGDTRRFQTASAAAFALLAIWNLVAVVTRLVRGDPGMLMFIELILLIGFAFQALWVWKVDLTD